MRTSGIRGFVWVLTPFVGMASPQVSAVQEAGASVTVRGSIEAPTCDRVRLGEIETSLDQEGRFSIVLPLKSANYLDLQCNSALRLFLTPGDDLAVDWQSAGAIFSGRGSEANNFLVATKRLWTKQEAEILGRYYQLVTRKEEAFVAGMKALAAQEREPLEQFLAGHDVDSRFAKVERARLLYPEAEGLLAYVLLHRQLTGNYSMEPTKTFYGFLDQLDLNDKDLLDVEEYRSFLSSYVAHQARRLAAEQQILKQGDNRSTRARYEVALRTFSEPAVRNHALHKIMFGHLENLGPKNLVGLMDRFRSNCTDASLVREVEELYQSELQRRQDHTIEVYKTVDGIGLDAHILLPPGHRATDRRPAYLWFHGAGPQYGQWWWCFACEHNQEENGMVVIPIEYRLHNRLGTTVLESIADAKSAVRWVRANATRLGIDPDRIVVAGMSGGGHLAAATALLADPEKTGGSPDGSAMPNAILMYAAPVDLAKDSWTKQTLADRGPVEQASPLQNVRAGQPPTLIVHGTKDPTCSFSDVAKFASAMRAADNRCELVPLSGASHHFYRDPKARSEALRATDKFLESLGFLGENRDQDQE